MPVYDFQSDQGKLISVLVRLDEPDHLRQVQTVDGVEYKRVYSAPLAAKDTRAGDMTKEDFARVTTDKKMTVGQMQDLAREMSQERAAKQGGRDPVQEKFYRDYEKKMGKKHLDETKRESRERLAKQGIRLD